MSGVTGASGWDLDLVFGKGNSAKIQTNVSGPIGKVLEVACWFQLFVASWQFVLFISRPLHVLRNQHEFLCGVEMQRPSPLRVWKQGRPEVGQRTFPPFPPPPTKM